MSEHGDHPDSHFCRAQMAYLLEFGQKFSRTVATLSCDNKNKVNVGSLAVSRYHQLQHFFPTTNAPVYSDHDFPTANAKIVPSGYLLLEHKGRQSRSQRPQAAVLRSASAPGRDRRPSDCNHRSSSTPPCLPSGRVAEDGASDLRRMKRDKLGRLHFKVPPTGQLFVVSRAQRFHEATAETHANDLTSIIRHKIGGRPGVCLSVDGGPDYSVKSIMTMVYFGRLWRDCQLDFLLMGSHAPGDSAYNRIEHAWSPLSARVAGVTLPIHLPGEEPPWKQNLCGEDLRKKEEEVFDHALQQLNGYWNEKLYNSFPVSASHIPCAAVPSPYNTHGMLVEFTDAGITRIRQEEQLQILRAELQFVLRHATRSSYMLQFLKCESVSCIHCSLHPVKAPEAVAFLRAHGNRLMTVRPSTLFPGHFCSFLECAFLEEDHHKAPLLPDVDLPSLAATDREDRLCSDCSRYVFKSKADQDRHCLLIHDHRARQRKTADSQAAIQYKCTFANCGLLFSSQYQLNKHKAAAGHKCRPGRKRKNVNQDA